MKVICILFVIGILCPKITVQEDIEAIQIVRPVGNYSFQYVEDNKLEKILNSEQIKDRYVVVVSIVGRMQTGKSLMLNFFLNYLRKTYDIWSPFPKKKYEADHWIDMNVNNGFDATKNITGTTKGIWAWPEIFTHDNIADGRKTGNKVAIILIDTEGLFNILKDLRYHTRIFALSTLFSSMQGYSVLKDVYSDTLDYLDIFSSYTVYGSRIVNSSTETPFQYFNFIIRDSEHPDESENATFQRIFSNDYSDQNRDIKERLQSVFETIRIFKLPYPGENVTNPTFDGNTTQCSQNFKDKIEKMVTEVLNPQNLVIKKINGERVKAKDLSRFLKEFTKVVENNITTPTSLVEVLANASNWMLQEKFVQLYNDSMYEKLDAIKTNTTKPYYSEDELSKIHTENKEKYLLQFKNLVKYGGDKLAAPFETSLSCKIDECFENIKRENELMRHNFEELMRHKPKTGASMWIWIGASIFVVLNVILFNLYKKQICYRAKSQKKHNQEDSSDASSDV